MIIKKYEAETETKAIMLANEELGKDAIVLNIKTIKPRGIYRFFRKATVEVTVAVDDNAKKVESLLAAQKSAGIIESNIESQGQEVDQDYLRVSKASSAKGEENAIEQRLDNLQELLVKQLSETKSSEKKEENTLVEQEQIDRNQECLAVVLKQLVDNEVDEEFAAQIIQEIKGTLKRETSVDNILTSIYQKIVLKLGEPVLVDLENKEKKFIFFIGPTGVGKTTTIAKMASYLKLEKNLKVALITADTYRIAAVEQLRTYAGILGIPLSVVYTKDELELEKMKYSDYDHVLIDTAGRSHKNVEQKKDLEELVNTVGEEERQVFLVLSATTKYKDLIRIAENYQIYKDYSIIFTKLDETTCLGNILNIRMLTHVPLSYTTWGQNVPDDFGSIDVQSIAKKLLGGNQ